MKESLKDIERRTEKNEDEKEEREKERCRASMGVGGTRSAQAHKPNKRTSNSSVRHFDLVPVAPLSYNLCNFMDFDNVLSLRLSLNNLSCSVPFQLYIESYL